MLLAVAVAAAAGGCSSTPKSQPEVTARNTAVLARLAGDLSQAATTTEFYAKNARKKLADANRADELLECERLYEEARGAVNALLHDIQGMVRSGGLIAESDLEARRQMASDAIVEFNSYAHEVLHPPGSTQAGDTKFLAALTLDGMVGVGKLLWEEVTKRKKAGREAHERWANAECDRLKAAEWASFTQIK